MPLWTFLFVSTIPFSAAYGRPCTPISFDHIQMKVTEAAFTDCAECRGKNIQEGTLTTAPTISIPALKCFQQAINQSIARHRSCEEGKPPSKRVPHGPCPTKDYISQTAQAFYDVTQCLGIKESEYFFALINQESKFHITAQSGTGASCYGQLTGIAIEDINRRINNRMPYEGNQKNCETVSSHFQKLPVTKVKKTNSKGRTYYAYVKTESALCRLHSNPYSCLFYAAAYYQEALKRARRLVDRMDLVLVKMKDGKKLIFKDEDHYEGYFSTRDVKQIASTTRISLIQDKDLATQIIALASYNGGPGKVRNIFRKLMDDVKGRLWHPSSQKAILSMLFAKIPWGIPKGDFVDVFSDHLTSQYRKETGDYAKHALKAYENISKGLAPACGAIPAEDALKPEKQYYEI